MIRVLILIAVVQSDLVTSLSLRYDDSRLNYDKIVRDLKLKSFASRQEEEVFQSEIIQHFQQSEILGLDFTRKSQIRNFAIPPSLQLDPDANKDVVQLIVSQGYPAQEFTVQTKDGFLLSLQRIPYGRNENASSPRNKNGVRPSVFIQHGLISSAADWVINFYNDSLGFILADNGYDVWLGNSRGNTYSRRHVSLHPDDDRFWDWTFDEMAQYDIPAFIDFILNKTGQSSLFYIGHSQGTIMAFASFSSLPEYQKKIRLFVGLAPLITLNHMKSSIRFLSLLSDQQGYALLGRRQFLPNDFIIKFLADTFCDESQSNWVCSNVIFLLCGYDTSNVNLTRLAVYMCHTPAGTSVKNMVHYAQFYRSKKFTMYDYDSQSENMKHYGQPTPPEYNPSLFKIPSLIYSGSHDWLADPQDIQILESTLPNIVGKFEIPGWNHVDFVWGIDAAQKLYYDIAKWLAKY